jgi:glycosyltransferase involved in cell wall biosynthesis
MRVVALTHVFPREPDDPSAPFLLTWAQAVRDAGVDLVVVAPHDAGLPPRHVVAGVPVRRVRYAPDALERLAYRGEMHRIALRPSGPPVLAGLLGGTAVALRRIVAAGRPAVVHVHWWIPGAVIARLARLAVPVMCTVHGTDVALIEDRPPLRPLARWAFNGAARVEAVSTDLAGRLEAAAGRRADAVNPMPLRCVSPLPDEGLNGVRHTSPAAAPAVPGFSDERGDALRVLAVGRLIPEKGFADLIAAAARLHQPVRVTVVGDGPERAALEDLAWRLGIEARFPGRLSPEGLRAAYGSADVVAQPSRREGFGLVAAEALVAGVPVVATDSGGARDVLPRTDLVAVGDIDALAARLDAIAADPQARERARRSGARQHLLERLAPAAAAARTIAGYRALVPPS